MRAFLSHSSRDKAFVEAVARTLGRQWCLFDKYAFETGDEFTESIEKYLEDADILVLFLSRHSVDSFWVDFEINLAFNLKIQKKIKSSLVFLLGEAIGHQDLPEWLRRGLVRQAMGPKATAREIRHHLADLQRHLRDPLFVGRRKEQERIEEALSLVDHGYQRRILVLHGLKGIGRQTLCEQTARNLLSFRSILPIAIEEGDGIREIAIKMADLIEPYNGSKGLKLIIQQIESLSFIETETRLKEQLQSAVRNREMPVFVDADGLLDDDGSPTPPVQSILKIVDEDPELYLGLITRRKPYIKPPIGDRVALVKVDPLSTNEVKRLLALLAQREQIKLEASEIADIAKFVAGYPPAAWFAINFAKEYGKDLLLSDKTQVVELRAESFFRYVTTQLRQTESRTRILNVLIVYSPLPLSILGGLTGSNPRQLSEDLKYLIDISVVYPGEDGLYAVAQPVVEAIERNLASFQVNHLKAAELLETYLKENQEETHHLALSRSYYRALVRSSSNTETSGAIFLRTDLLKILKSYYHERNFDVAVEWGRQALELWPDSRIRSYFVRALIQQELYDEAQGNIDELQKEGRLRDALFLKGFLERKRGDRRRAISHYVDAVRAGLDDIAIHRELALCYFHEGDLNRAAKHLEKAKSIRRESPYIVDLEVQIALKTNNKDLARQKLETLRIVDEPDRYQHRLSSYEYQFGDREAAYEAARKAVDLKPRRPSFEVLTQLAKCEISTRRLDEAAATIKKLGQLYAASRKDIHTGLQMRLQIELGKYEYALSLWQNLKMKDLPVHKALKRDALKGELRSPALDDALRARYMKELQRIESELKGVNLSEFEIV